MEWVKEKNNVIFQEKCKLKGTVWCLLFFNTYIRSCNTCAFKHSGYVTFFYYFSNITENSKVIEFLNKNS